MKHLLVALALCSLSIPAHAEAAFCLSVTPATAVKQEACWGIPDAALGDLVSAYAATYFPNGVQVSPAVPEVRDAAGTVTTPAKPAASRAPTSKEVLDAMGDGLKSGILANVISWKRSQAAIAATSAVTDITAIKK